MTQYDYKVVPAPARGAKAKGVKGVEARFAHAVELQLNQLAAEGWEYQRAETLPSEERQGLTQSVTNYRSVLIFRRPQRAALDGFQPRPLTVDTAAADNTAGSDTATDSEARSTAATGATTAGAAKAAAEATTSAAPDSATDTATEIETGVEAEREASKRQMEEQALSAALRDRVAQLMDRDPNNKG